MLSQLESLQDIRIFDVGVEGNEVCLDLFGGNNGVCGSLRLTFDGEHETETRLLLLRRWQRDQTRLTLVSHDSQVTLTDDAALVAAAIDGQG